MLDEKETIEYIRRAKGGDQTAKQALIDGNVSLIKCIVKRYLGKGVEYDDLFQLACMGFLKAITGFDESFGVRFSTYAVPMIAGEIKRFMRDDGSVKVSRAMKQTGKGYEYLCRRIYHRPRHAADGGTDRGKIRTRRKRNGVRDGVLENARFHLRRVRI